LYFKNLNTHSAITYLLIALVKLYFFFNLMQILAYILRFGMAWFSLTCPFSPDWKKSVPAHALSDVNADKLIIIDGVGG